MRTRTTLFLLAIFLAWNLNTAGQTKRFEVVFYNVENLFDTDNDPATNDDAFTPEGINHWTNDRYKKKLEDVATVLGKINPKHLPDLIGLCEVENTKVLKDLTAVRPLKKRGYRVVHEDSPDSRGIDVGLLYNPESFSYISHRIIPVNYPRDTLKGRDILYIKGKVSGENIHIFVNHWKSRRGSARATEQKRIYNAVLVRRAVDSIFNTEPSARIIIMGDFNDEPTNMSILNVLNATNKRKNISPRDLYNLMYDAHNLSDTGTYSYKGKWNMLDQIIVSRAFLDNTKGWHTTYDGGHIFSDDFMLYYNAKADQYVPGKTYGGSTYYGGISDHLPVYVIFEKGKKKK
ncbi:MAG: hypothetical protein GXO83_05080 [Chlorobi bacterium]|nr:hypothetical protein [Chlorobiota bacterium]